MKKISCIVIALIYLVTIAGVTLSVHHCHGKTAYTLMGISINKTCKCPHTSPRHVSKCCDNKTLVLQNYSDCYSPKQLLEIQSVTHFKDSDHHIALPVCKDVSEGNSHYIRSAPDIPPVPLYITNRVILI